MPPSCSYISVIKNSHGPQRYIIYTGSSSSFREMASSFREMSEREVEQIRKFELETFPPQGNAEDLIQTGSNTTSYQQTGSALPVTSYDVL